MEVVNLNPISLHNLLSNLKLIGHIKKGDKLSICGDEVYILSDTLYNRICRTIRSFIQKDNRNSTFDYVSKNIRLAFDILKMKDCPAGIVTSIKADLSKCFEGLCNLQNTYEGDVLFIVKIETLVEEIKLRIV